jgi:TPR repeat protein
MPADEVREAARYFKLAAEQGDASRGCTEQLPVLGPRKGVAKDVVEAARYYKLAADQGMLRAKFAYYAPFLWGLL